MSLAVLYETPRTPEEFATWSFAHAAAHRDISRVVFADNGTILPEYILDPFDPLDSAAWLYQHQLMHQAQNDALGIAGFQLNEVDWFNSESLGNWLWAHGQEHLQAGRILGLG